VVEVPDHIRYFEPLGSTDRVGIWSNVRRSIFPTEPLKEGFLSFGTQIEVNDEFGNIGKFEIKDEILLTTFLQGVEKFALRRQDASNLAISMFRRAWESTCRTQGLLEYAYSNAIGFHASEKHVKIGQKIPWGKQGERRSAMLRNIARGHAWQFGISAIPAFWPYPHFKLKSRALFSPAAGAAMTEPYDDAKKQHRLRRTVCKGWRNRQWHGRLMAFIELLSADSSYIQLPLSPSTNIKLEAAPILFTSPVSTFLPDTLDDEHEESDETTLGRPTQRSSHSGIFRTFTKGFAF
ncbi:MAG: hypothetical protein HC869_00490, partial [Rhodospirillales bacterium]|nr:hypothetical protein [Rhodospirillales bacterium]